MKKSKFTAAGVSHYPDADGNEVPGTEQYATKEEYDAAQAAAQAAAASGGGESGKFQFTDSFWEGVTSNINNLLKIWQPSESYLTVNNNGGTGGKQNNNTMLYLGIGGAVLVVILLLVVVLKK